MATKYTISYDLLRPGKDYQPLYTALHAMNGERALLSQWVVVRHNTDAMSLLNHFRQFIDANDRLLVQDIDGTGWASWNSLIDINRKAA